MSESNKLRRELIEEDATQTDREREREEERIDGGMERKVVLT